MNVENRVNQESGATMENPSPSARQGDSSLPGAGEDRRRFLAQAITLVLGTVSLLVPAVVGIVAYLNPLRWKGQTGEWVRLASLEMLPKDGTPRTFSVIADRTDAWNRFPNEPIGAVFLRRTGDEAKPVLALQVICPHAGCSIQYIKSAEGGYFFCPCHRASFDLSGERLHVKSNKSPRGLDELEVDKERARQGEIRVKFQNFKMGISDPEPRT